MKRAWGSDVAVHQRKGGARRSCEACRGTGRKLRNLRRGGRRCPRAAGVVERHGIVELERTSRYVAFSISLLDH